MFVNPDYLVALSGVSRKQSPLVQEVLYHLRIHSPFPRQGPPGRDVRWGCQQHLHGAVLLEELELVSLSIFVLVTGSPQVDAGNPDDLLP